tara:strand:+ start:5638 stop:6228 length:591 start_codon:yes stop_codon:yes gene_type:complete
MTSAAGFIHGTGAALNIELGFIPDYVEVTNLTDGDIVQRSWLGKAVVFTSGGVGQVKPGQILTGATSGATMVVKQVILDSGTWAGGDAAGWFIVDSIVGTIASENVNASQGLVQSNVAGVVVDVEFGVDINTEVAGVTGNAGMLRYEGDAANGYAQGFTIGTTISENGKLLGYMAIRNDPGMGETKVLGSNQETLW